MISRRYLDLIVVLVAIAALCVYPTRGQALPLDLQEVDFEGNAIADTFITRDNRTQVDPTGWTGGGNL